MANGVTDNVEQTIGTFPDAAELMTDTVDVLREAGTYLFVGLNSKTAVYQFLAIAAAIAVAFVLSRLSYRAKVRFMEKYVGEGFVYSAVRLCVRLAHSLVFSVSAAAFLALCVMLLRRFGLVGAEQGGRLILVTVADQIFCAWAILLVLMQFFSTVLGRSFFSAGRRRFVTTVFWVLAALEIMGVLGEIIAFMKRFTLPIGSESVTLWTLFVSIITVLLTLAVANKLADLCEASILRVQDVELNIRVVMARLVRVALMAAAVLIALSSVGINLTVLSVFGGAFGVGIGFGMQKIASNYISGFIILFDRSVKLGDMVEVGGFAGTVTQINTRYSVLRNLAGEELIVPNENFVTGTVKNYSLSDRECVINVEISCAYEADVDRALEVLLECVEAEPRVMKQRAPWAIVSSFGDSGINLKAGFWVNDPQKGTGGLKSSIMRRCLKRYIEEGIEIPYNKLDLTVKNSPLVVQSDSSPKKA